MTESAASPALRALVERAIAEWHVLTATRSLGFRIGDIADKAYTLGRSDQRTQDAPYLRHADDCDIRVSRPAVNFVLQPQLPCSCGLAAISKDPP